MFQFPGLPPPPLCVRGGGDAIWVAPGFPIRRPAGRRACAPHRGLSQLAASFIGFQCQGIHRAPFPSSILRQDGRYVTYPSVQMRSTRKISLLRYAALKVRSGGEPSGPDAATSSRGPAKRTGVDGPPRSRFVSLLVRLILPRKEVIQPHVPVRLPCYDFTPLTLHTFGASPHCWLGRRLRVQSTRVV